MPIQTTNPATNKVIKSFEEMTDTAADKAVAQATKAFETWRKSSFQQRKTLLHKVAITKN